MALLLCGCASNATKFGETPLARAIPTQTCEAILTKVPLPPVKPTDDARSAFIRDDAALLTANGRIATGKSCIAAIRTDYAAPKKGSAP